jgi:uncharacterized protein
MNSSNGPLDVFDAHVHFFSNRFFHALASQSAELSALPDPLGAIAARTSFVVPDADPERLAADWKAELERHAVGGALLIASVPGDEESVAAAVRAYPTLFHGAFMLDPTREDAAERARRAFDDLGLQMVCLFPAMHGYGFAECEGVRGVCALAADRPGTLVFVHCGVLSVGIRRKLGLPSLFDMRRSNPLDVHALASEFSRVPFVIPHFGAGMFRETLMLADLCANVVLDTSSSNGWTKYLDTPRTLDEVFARALDIVGHERLVFGSDSSFFPRGWNAAVFATQSASLTRVGVDADAERSIFGGNMRRLLARQTRAHS